MIQWLEEIPEFISANIINHTQEILDYGITPSIDYITVASIMGSITWYYLYSKHKHKKLIHNFSDMIQNELLVHRLLLTNYQGLANVETQIFVDNPNYSDIFKFNTYQSLISSTNLSKFNQGFQQMLHRYDVNLRAGKITFQDIKKIIDTVTMIKNNHKIRTYQLWGLFKYVVSKFSNRYKGYNYW